MLLKKYLIDALDTITKVRVYDDLNERFLQAPVNNIPHHLQINKKTQIPDATKITSPNTGNDLLQKWKVFCNSRNSECKPSDFIQSTKTNSPTAYSGASSLSPIGASFFYVETSGNNHDSSNDKVFVSFERSDILQFSNITFYHNRFSTSIPEKRNMGKLEIQFLVMVYGKQNSI